MREQHGSQKGLFDVLMYHYDAFELIVLGLGDARSRGRGDGETVVRYQDLMNFHRFLSRKLSREYYVSCLLGVMWRIN